MALLLHCGANPIDYPSLREVETPEATPSHVPIPHHRVVDMVRHTLGFYGHEVIDEHHGLTPDGMRYFGVMLLRSAYGNYEDAVAIRNSHDKSFPVGIGFGGHVFCCDNMSLMADHVIKRRHTAKAKHDLPGLISAVVEPLADARDQQQKLFNRYRATHLTPEQADHAMMEMYRNNVINLQRIQEVDAEWTDPSFEEMRQSHTAFRLFNAATFVLNGRIVGQPKCTQALHRIMNDVCSRAFFGVNALAV
jgi:hypothetical protein